MTIASRVKGGRLGIWKKPVSGDPMAPFNDPTGHVDAILFHSDMQYLAGPEEHGKTISHTSLAGAKGTGYSVSSGAEGTVVNGLMAKRDHTLFTHNLGYPPVFFVLIGGIVIGAGHVVQNDNHGARFVAPYATATKIGLSEIALSSTSALSAKAVTYRIIICADPAADPAKPAMHVKPSADVLVFGNGKVDIAKRPLRRVGPGDAASFYLPQTPTADVGNGAICCVSADGVSSQIGGSYTGALFDLDAIEVTF